MKYILIADDDAMVARGYARIISSLISKSTTPCRVETFLKGEAVMARLKAMRVEDRDDLMLITDGDMSPAGGVWNGEELIHEARVLCGNSLKKVLLVSTLSEWPRLEELHALYIQKPMSARDLVQHVEEFLKS